MPIIKRTINKLVLDTLQYMPVVFLNGPRQAGKSTLANNLAKTLWPAAYVSMDEPTQLAAAQASPQIFLQAHPGALVIDEVQMAPELFRAIKIIVDNLRFDNLRAGKKSPSGRFLLTGSANLMSLPTLADALVGRMSVLTLYPLSAVEITKGKGDFLKTLFANNFRSGKSTSKHNLVDIIRRATFPEISSSDEASRRRWFESYIMTILQRDVRQMSHIEKLGVLPHLLQVLAARAGGLFNEADIARSIKQNAVTTKHYRLLLQMIFIVFDIRPWFKNIGKRLVKSPKIYIIDTALLCHLQQIDLSSVANTPLFGHVLENFVATELLKQLSCFDASINLLYFRTSDGKEVDFVLQQRDGTLAGIEVKAKDNVNADDFKGLQELKNAAGKDFICGIVLYRGNSCLPFGDRLWALPVDRLWQ